MFYSHDVFVCIRVRVQRADDVLEVCPTILTEDSMQAQHLAATQALYILVKGQVISFSKSRMQQFCLLMSHFLVKFLASSVFLLAVNSFSFFFFLLSFCQSVHQLLPPTYRDVWLEWRDSEQQQQEESRTAANKPRDQFISRLLTRLKQQQQNQSQGQQSSSQSQLDLSSADKEEPEESWENLAGLDIGERGEDVKDKSEISGGKREGAAALEAARELLLKLKKSPLAQKLKVNTPEFFYVDNFHMT